MNVSAEKTLFDIKTIAMMYLSLVGTPCFVAGWGTSKILWEHDAKTQKYTIKEEFYENKLQVLAINILNRKICENAFRNSFRKMGPDHVCAGSNVLKKSPCHVI